MLQHGTKSLALPIRYSSIWKVNEKKFLYILCWVSIISIENESYGIGIRRIPNEMMTMMNPLYDEFYLKKHNAKGLFDRTKSIWVQIHMKFKDSWKVEINIECPLSKLFYDNSKSTNEFLTVFEYQIRNFFSKMISLSNLLLLNYIWCVCVCVWSNCVSQANLI